MNKKSSMVILLVGIGLFAFSAELYVSPDGSDTNDGSTLEKAFLTVSKAVATASSSVTTTVWVAEGTYVFANHVYINKPIELRSLAGAERTLFTTPSAENGFFSCNHAAIFFSGFTFSNACRVVTNQGGAVWDSGAGARGVEDCVFVDNRIQGTLASALYMRNANFTLRRCVFRNNTYAGTMSDSSSAVYLGGDGSVIEDCVFEGNNSAKGGACFLTGSANTITLSRCTFTGNSCSNDYGGAVYGSAKALFYDCVFSNNYAYYAGGAANSGKRSVFDRCTFVGNNARVGGAIHGDTYAISNCLFEGNIAREQGGAVNFQGGTNSLSHCIIRNNTAQTSGFGAVKSIASYDLIANCLFTGNVSATEPGGINLVKGGELFNCTFWDNVVTNNKGVVAVRSEGRTYNTILWNNHHANGTVSDYYGTSNASITNSCVGTGTVQANAGNISADPLFRDSPAGDFSLLRSSPCVNAGMTFDWLTGGKDLAGKDRVNDSVVDMGAYEYYPSRMMTLLSIR